MTGKPKELSKSAKEGIKRATGRVVYKIHDLIENGDVVEIANGESYRYVGRSTKDGMCVIQSIDEPLDLCTYSYDMLKLIRKNQLQ